MRITNRSGVQSLWDIVNMGFTFTVHAVMAALGWFVMSSSVEDSALNISVQGLGSVLGWWIGMWVSPSSSRQRADMTSFVKTLAAFASGYVLLKIDPLISRLLSTDVNPNHYVSCLGILVILCCPGAARCFDDLV